MDEAKDARPRRCGTCLHFEPSTSWRRGWCRNSLLFGPGQSQSVLQDELFCGSGHGDFWEPHRSPGDESPETAGHANVKRPSLSPLRLFEPATPFPQLAGATASAGGGSMLFARNSGSGSGGGGGRRPDDLDPEFDDVDETTYAYDDDQPAAAPRSGRGRRTASPEAGGSGGSAGGRQRTVQFQPEERYWTEYLRIALPVIGLLLMLGLFWFWAQQLIGDDNKEPEATNAPGMVVTPTEQINVPTATVQVVVTAEPTQPPAPTQPAAEPTATTATANPATPPAAEIAVGSTVTTTEEVNMRPEASTTGDPVAQIPAGTTLTVIGGPQEADGYTWWQVEDAAGDTGWVAADFIQASGE